jgi:hypothetical protein
MRKSSGLYRVNQETRPNVRPAKYVPLAEGVYEKIKQESFVRSGKRYKKTIVDVCDHCKKYVLIQRKFFFLLARGWKFYHVHCYRVAHPTGTCKENKAIVGLDNG